MAGPQRRGLIANASRRVAGIAALCSVLGALHYSSAATAQELVPPKAVSVTARPRPEFEAPGIALGGLRLYPQLTAGASFDDNVFATHTDEVHDRIGELAGNLRLESQNERHPGSLYASAESASYDDNPDESYADRGAGGSIGFTLARQTSVTLTADYAVTHETRGDPSFPVEAIERPETTTDTAGFEIGHEFASGTLKLRVDGESRDFGDAKLADGDVFDQDFRDLDSTTTELEGRFAVGASTGAFVRATRIERNAKFSDNLFGLDRDSTTDSILGGAVFQVTNLMHGELGVGVLELDNADPSQNDSRSVGFDTKLEFFVTQLMTINLKAQRTSAAADLDNSSTYVGTNATVGVDYEMRRNLILSLSTGETRREYSGADENDTAKSTGVGARWLANPHLSVHFQLTHTKRSWPVEDGPQYTGNVASVAVQFAL